jgi:hypothetical protein
MKRSLAVLVLLLSFFYMPAQQTTEPEITITREVKKLAAPGEFEIKITLRSTGAVTSYARYKELIPVVNRNAKFTCTSNGGASFTASDTEIKFLWTNISLNKVIEIIYLVQDAEQIVTDLPGTFTFVDKNVIHSVKLEEKNMSYSEK